jgi:hypothetical protein
VAYSEVDRVWIRHFLGFSAIFTQADPRLENAVTATQSLADGGVRPDASTENYIKAVIYGVAAVAGTQAGVVVGPASTTGVTFQVPASRGLIQIEANIALQDQFLGTSEVDGKEIQIDPAREIKRLRVEGRRLVNHLARMLATHPRADIFSNVAPDPGGDAFYGFLESSRYQW